MRITESGGLGNNSFFLILNFTVKFKYLPWFKIHITEVDSVYEIKVGKKNFYESWMCLSCIIIWVIVCVCVCAKPFFIYMLFVNYNYIKLEFIFFFEDLIII